MTGVSKLDKRYQPTAQEIQQTPAEQIQATTKETPKRIMAKLLKNVNKEEISKVVKKKKRPITYLET